jgi:glutathione S-transferase
MVEPLPFVTAYVARLEERPACRAAEARNAEVRREHGLG